jgi:CRP/FNR family transcriptional regulator, nitrogen oxide reductase regulator
LGNSSLPSATGLKGGSMKDDVRDRIAVMKEGGEFAHLTDEALAELAALAVPCFFRKGEFIFHEDDLPKFYYVVQSGRVKLLKQSPSGRQVITRFVLPGNPLNAIVLFTKSPHFVSAVAMNDMTLLRINKEAYLSFALRHPSHMLKIIARTEKTLRSAWSRLTDTVGESVKQRVLNVLCALSNKFGDTLTFTCLEIGELSGTTTETVIRVMKELTSLKIVEHTRGTIKITDTAELRKLSREPFDI